MDLVYCGGGSRASH